MEAIRLATDEPYIRVVVDYINFLFRTSKECVEYWNSELKKSLIHSYFYVDDGQALEEAIAAEGSNLRDCVHLPTIMRKLPDRLGIRFKHRSASLIADIIAATQTGAGAFIEQVLTDEEIELVPIVKSCSLAGQGQAFLQYHSALNIPSGPEGQEEKHELVMKTLKSLMRTAYTKSADPLLTFRYLVKCIFHPSVIASLHYLVELNQFLNYFDWVVDNVLYLGKKPRPVEPTKKVKSASVFLLDAFFCFMKLFDLCWPFDVSVAPQCRGCIPVDFAVCPPELMDRILCHPRLLLVLACPSLLRDEAFMAGKEGFHIPTLCFKGWQFLRDTQLEKMAEVLKGAASIDTLFFQSFGCITTKGLVSFLQACGGSLKKLVLKDGNMSPVVKDIAACCPQLESLTIRRAFMAYSAKEGSEWLSALMASHHNILKELRVDFEFANSDDLQSLLSNLEILVAPSVHDLFIVPSTPSPATTSKTNSGMKLRYLKILRTPEFLTAKTPVDLSSIPGLESLVLKWNSGTVAPNLAAQLALHCPKLGKFSLKMGISSEFLDIMRQGCTRLRTCKIACNSKVDQILEKLAESYSSTLEILNLDSFQGYCEGSCLPHLLKLSNLKTLSLNQNRSAVSFAIFPQLLAGLPQMTDLELPPASDQQLAQSLGESVLPNVRSVSTIELYMQGADSALLAAMRSCPELATVTACRLTSASTILTLLRY